MVKDTARSTPGRPAQISRERIVEAAFAAGNLDELTMRALAAHLGVTHGALYRWVKNRDELFDLISAVIVERILTAAGPREGDWRAWLRRVGSAMHDELLAAPGYASHLSRPHRHAAGAFERLRTGVTGAFVEAGATGDLAEQSWYIFITGMVSWLANEERPLELGAGAPRFDLFLEAMLRGLPAEEPG